MSLPRGFKANAERESLRLRRELGLAPAQALDITRLAGHLDVEIVSAGDLIDVTRLEELERIQAYSFSAATAIGTSGADNRAWIDAAGTRFGSGRGDR